jgi:hypothetical protein
MKIFTLTTLATLLTLSVAGQNLKKAPIPAPGKELNYSAQTSVQTKSLKGGGEVFWTEEFNWANSSSEIGWLLPEGWKIEDPADIGYNWHWANDTLKGVYTTEPPIHSTSMGNGFLALNADGYNQDLGHYDNYIAVNSSIISPKINCTGHPSVLVRIEQNFRWWPSSVQTFEVTNDNGVHWASFDMKMGSKISERVGGIRAGEKVDIYLNLSDVAANMPEVQFKITWRDAKLYYWMLDDITFMEGWNNDLQLLYSEANYNNGTENKEGFFYAMPKSQISGYDFMGVIRNFGNDEQWGTHLNVKVTKNNQIIYDHSTTPYTLYPGITDTVTIPDQFLPVDFGHYQIDFKLAADIPDEVPADNSATAPFLVTDSLYSRCDDYAEQSFSTWEWYTVPHEGDYMGTWYRINKDIEVNSISAYINSADIACTFRLVLFGYNPETDSPVELLGSETVSMDSTILKNHWVTLPLSKDGEGEFLKAGQSYLAAIQLWNNMDFQQAYDSERYSIGSDRSNYFPSGTCWYYFSDDDAWYSTGEDLFMIRLNLNDHSNPVDGIPANPLAQFSVGQNYPNPFNHETRINFNLPVSGEVRLLVKDLTGRLLYDQIFRNLHAGDNQISLSGANLEAGHYFYTIQSGDVSQTKKMTVIR